MTTESNACSFGNHTRQTGTLADPTSSRPIGTFPIRGSVPYITAWSSEQRRHSELVVRGNRLAYADEHPMDRDRDGVLWSRIGISPGKGKPQFGKVHGLRQRRTMLRALCQVCGGPAERNSDGVLWLLGRAEYEWRPWPAPIETVHPPLCLPCALLAVKLCPHLRDQFVALRAQQFRRSGVFGACYSYSRRLRRLQAFEAQSISLDSPQVPWVQANQIVVWIDDYRLVDLADEAARQGVLP